VATKLYDELDQAAANLRLCDDVQLYWLLMPDGHPFRISQWGEWLRLFPKDDTRLYLAAQHLDVHYGKVMARCNGRSDSRDRAVEERHSRFVAAVALAQLVAPGDVSASDVVAKWGAVTKDGVSVAALEKLQVRHLLRRLAPWRERSL
jgi:hypothetical protein